MYIMQLKKRKIVFSHATALFLHGLTTRNPITYDVTVPQGYNTATLKKIGCHVHSIRPSLYDLGLTTVPSVFGNTLSVYDIERTLCDMVKDKKRQDLFVYAEGFMEYVTYPQKRLDHLTEYSRSLGVEEKMRFLMDVVL